MKLCCYTEEVVLLSCIIDYLIKLITKSGLNYYDILITIVYNRDLLRLAPLIIFNLNHHLIGYIGPALVADLAFNYCTFK